MFVWFANSKVQLSTYFSLIHATTPLIIGKPYKDASGKNHPYGHVALRVFNATEGYDYVYDFGRYGRTWGIGGSKGEGILNIYNSSETYFGHQQGFRSSVEFIKPTSVEQDKKIISFYSDLAEKGEVYKKGSTPGGGGKAFKLEKDYDVLTNNCCTISGAGLEQVSINVVNKEFDPRKLLDNIERNFKELGFVRRTEYLQGGDIKVTYERINRRHRGIGGRTQKSE